MIPGIDTGGGGFQGSSKSGDAVAHAAASAAIDRSGNISFAQKNSWLPWAAAALALGALVVALWPRAKSRG